ncbi:MAG TPA: DUF5677 domain-containing protein [Thermoguttaceae bacterium]
MRNPKWEFGSIDASYKSWQIFNRQVALLEDGLKSVYLRGKDIDLTIFPLIYAILDSCHSISTLAQTGKVRDIFVLARSVLETIINVCFIYAQGTEAAEKISRHAEQKSIRDLERELRFNTSRIRLKWEGQDELVLKEEVKQALNEFTTTTGKDERKWTPENLIKRLEVIASKYEARVGTSLAFGIFSIYRHASEILHGTLFGVLFVLGFTKPNWKPIEKTELEKLHVGNLQMLLIILGFNISALILVLSVELDNKELAEATKLITEELKVLFEKEFSD